jgi:hypothetical protein
MAASGSGGNGPGGRPWTATSTWAPGPGGGDVEEAISLETSDEDAEVSPSGVVLSRQLLDGDGNAPPCEVTGEPESSLHLLVRNFAGFCCELLCLR